MRAKFVREVLRESLSVAWPEAFCIIALRFIRVTRLDWRGITNLSMTVIRGATIVAAQNPDAKSEANLRPKFLVFHTLGSSRGASAAVDTGDPLFEIDPVSIPSLVGLSSPGVLVIVKPLIPSFQVLKGIGTSQADPAE